MPLRSAEVGSAVRERGRKRGKESPLRDERKSALGSAERHKDGWLFTE